MSHKVPLSNYISINDIPDNISFIGDGLNKLFNDVKVENLENFGSRYQPNAIYLGNLLLSQEFSLGFKGLPISLVLNANPSPGNSMLLTSIPFSFYIEKYKEKFRTISNLKINNFIENPLILFDFVKEYFNVSILDLLEFSITEFENKDISSFISKVNNEYSLTTPINWSNEFSNYKLDIAICYKILLENEELQLQNIHPSSILLDIYLLDLFSSQSSSKFNFLKSVVGNPEKVLWNLLIPNFSLKVYLNVALKFERNILIPMKLDLNTNKYIEEIDESVKTLIYCAEAEFELSSKSFFGADAKLEFSFPSSYPKAKIAGTELTIGFSKAILDFSKEKNTIKEQNYQIPKDFIGVFIQDATIGFPASWNHDSNSTAEIIGRNLLIGTGGITGTIGIEAKEGITTAPLLKLKLGQDFNISLDAFSITFQQSSIISSLIKGTLTIPGVKKKEIIIVNGEEQEGDYSSDPVIIDIEAFIGNNGEFKINAQPVGGLSFFIENVARIDITSLSLGKENDKYYISVAGALDFSELAGKINGVNSDFPTNIPLKKLKIWEDGKMEFDAGIIALPRAISLEIGPAKLAVTSLLFSSTELYHKGKKRQYGVIGFDGSLDIKPGGVSVKGEGVKICYTTDNKTDVSESSPDYRPLHIFLRIEGIGLEITVPSDASISEADFYLKGHLAIKNPEGEGETMKSYAGQIAFSINKAKIAGSATMDYNPNIPSWLIDAEVSVPAGIPMGSTGLAIYGFKGLAGKNKRFDKNDEETWWKLYKRPEEGINKSKFKTGKGLAVGLGVSLASQTDNGRPFSSVLVLMLGLPDVVMLQGQAAFMRDRVQFGEKDPPFSALLSIDKHSVQAGLGVKYSISENIAKLNGEAEMAYFWKNSKAWYINFGKDTPDNARITARIFSLFDAYAYLMISASGVKMGAGAKWEFTKKYGPVGVGASAYIDAYGRISFNPAQIGGGIAIGGYAYANISKFKIGFSLAAYLEAEAPKPFQIKGGVNVKLELPRPLKNKGINLEFAWMFDAEKIKDALPILEISNIEGKISKPAKAINMLTSESFEVNIQEGSKPDNIISEDFPIIPVDSFIDLAFSNSPIDVTLPNSYEILPNSVPPNPNIDYSIVIGGQVTGVENNILVPPQKGLSEQVKHAFELTHVKIFSYNGTEWKPYNIYEASNVIKQLPSVVADLALNTNYLKTLPQAHWQLIEADKNTQLRIMSQNMFSYMNQTQLGSIETERLGYEGGVVFCEQTKISNNCIDWENEDENTLYTANKAFNKDGVKIIVYGKDGVVKTISNTFNLNKGLEFSESEGIELQFSEPQSVVIPKLKVSSGNLLFVEYITKITTEFDHNNLPIYKYQTIQTDKLNASQIASYSGYSDENTPVYKVKITFMRTGMLNANHDAPLRIGYSNFVNNSYTNLSDNQFLSIDEIMIIGKGMNFEEVFDVYKNGYSGGNIIADWQMNGNSNDISGNSFNGTQKKSYITPSNVWPYSTNAVISDNNNPLFLTGRLNNTNEACFLGGNNTSPQTIRFIEIPHANELSIGKDNFTISAWVKVPPLFNYRDGMNYESRSIVSKMDKNNGGYELEIYNSYDAKYNKLSALEGGLYFKYQVDNTTGVHVHSCVYNEIADGNWHHIVITRATEKRNLYEEPYLDIYVDGNWLHSRLFYIPTLAPSSDNASIHSLCNLSQEKHTFNLNIPPQQTLNEQNNKMLDGLTKIVQPIWRPDTKYAIEVNGKDTVDGTAHNRTYNVLFQTKGATGHFIKENTTQDADDFLIGKIKGYIDYKNSYPNAEGKLLNSKPIFYKAPSIHLFYNSPYMNLMFESWQDSDQNILANYNLTLQVTDAKASQNNALALQPVWSTVKEKVENQDIAKLNNLLRNGSNCWGHNGELSRTMHKTEYVLPDLLPNNLYSATYFSKNVIDNNVQDAEVHKHVFQTSKYGNFTEQIEGFRKSSLETINSVLINENFSSGNGGFAAQSGSSLTINDRLYIESASHPSTEVSIDVVENMIYSISLDFIGASFNAGGNTNVYCLVDGKKIYTNSILNNNSSIQNLNYSFQSETTGTITLAIVLENNNIGKIEYFIIDNFDVSIPVFNNLLVDEDFSNSSLGDFFSTNGSSIDNPSGDVLLVEFLDQPKCTKVINVVSGVSYSIMFQLMSTSTNSGMSTDILVFVPGITSFIQPVLGVFPVVVLVPFTSSFTGAIPIDISFAMPANMGTQEFFEIDDFQVNEFINSPISVMSEKFDINSGLFVPSQFSSLALSNKLYIEAQNSPKAELSINLEAGSQYTLSFDVVGKSFNQGDENIICTVGNIVTESIPVSIGSNYTIKFNAIATNNVLLSFSLLNINSGELEYLMITNLKLSSEIEVEVITDALYTIEKPFDSNAIQDAINIITESSSQNVELVSKFSLEFDRLLNGALYEIGTLQASVDTEIVKIINLSDNNKLIGVIIRNPEPFFNSNISSSDLTSSLIVERHFGTNQIDSNYKLVFSKDLSNVFITKNNLEIETGDYHFNFKYLEYDGSSYILKTSENQLTLNVTI